MSSQALSGAQINEAKAVLADEATRMLHGEGCLEEIRATAATLFGGAKQGASDTSALPRVQLSAAAAAEGVPVIDLFIQLEFGKSKGEVRRLVQGGGAKLNDVKIEDAALLVSADTFADASEIKLSSGKKKHGIIELVD